MCFHSYLFGHSFKLQTDHKPLLTLFNESKAVSPQTSAMLGIDPSIVRIHNRVPNNNTTCKCRCYEEVATPGHASPDTCFRRASADGWKIGGCPHLSSTDSNVDMTRSLAVKSALLHQRRMARQYRHWNETVLDKTSGTAHDRCIVWECADWTPWRTPWYITNEVACTRSGVVARNESGDWDSCLPNLEFQNPLCRITVHSSLQPSLKSFVDWMEFIIFKLHRISLRQMDWLKELYKCLNRDFASHQDFCSSTELHHIQPLVCHLLKCCWAWTSALSQI